MNTTRFVDLTTLGTTDSEQSVREFAQKIAAMETPPAAVCSFPNFVDTMGLAIGDSPVRIAGVVGGFPAGQTYLEVKMLEAAMAVENGADEVDMPMNIGAFLAGNEALVKGEIETIRGEIGEDVTLKIIIESGVLANMEAIRRAALLAAEAGADFVKTSTGRAPIGATPEAARTICQTLRDYAEQTGRRVGIKISGGIRTHEEAQKYIDIVRETLGDEWITPELFRIGTSTVF